MGKSVEELRRILKRMQSDLEKPRSEDSAVQEEEPEAPAAAPHVRPSLTPHHYDDPPPVQAQQQSQAEPAARPPLAAQPTGWSSTPEPSPYYEQPRWLDPSRRVFTMDSVGQRLVLWCAVLTSTAGLYFENMPLAGLGMLWLALRAFSIGFESSNELEDLVKRIAALERRVSRVSSQAAEESISDIDEDVQELKTLVKTLFKAISAEEEETKPKPEEKNDDD